MKYAIGWENICRSREVPVEEILLIIKDHFVPITFLGWCSEGAQFGVMPIPQNPFTEEFYFAVIEVTFFSKPFEYANDRSTFFSNRAAFFFQEVVATTKTSGITFGTGILEEFGRMLGLVDERFQSLKGTISFMCQPWCSVER